MVKNRTIIIRGEFVTCINCSVCYDREMKPTYCQYFNKPINENDVDENHTRAHQCKEFCPTGLPRYMRKSSEKSVWQFSEEEKINLDRFEKLGDILENIT